MVANSSLPMERLAPRFRAVAVDRLENGCWIWLGRTRSAPRYGAIYWNDEAGRHSVGAHRISYILAHGTVSPTDVVMHICDTPLCVNPDHLRAGTQGDNMRDAARKGRVVSIGRGRLTECIRGHAFDTRNTYFAKDGHRSCRACARAYQRERNRRIRQQ